MSHILTTWRKPYYIVFRRLMSYTSTACAGITVHLIIITYILAGYPNLRLLAYGDIRVIYLWGYYDTSCYSRRFLVEWFDET
jgi:hypothetical protein